MARCCACTHCASYRNDVFEPRMATGRKDFTVLVSFDTVYKVSSFRNRSNANLGKKFFTVKRTREFRSPSVAEKRVRKSTLRDI